MACDERGATPPSDLATQAKLRPERVFSPLAPDV
jgi:hypothetical protein